MFFFPRCPHVFFFPFRGPFSVGSRRQTVWSGSKSSITLFFFFLSFSCFMETTTTLDVVVVFGASLLREAVERPCELHHPPEGLRVHPAARVEPGLVVSGAVVVLGRKEKQE